MEGEEKSGVWGEEGGVEEDEHEGRGLFVEKGVVIQCCLYLSAQKNVVKCSIYFSFLVTV